jgi:hypothetical protein
MPGAWLAHSLVCKIKKHTSKSPQVRQIRSGIPRANGFTASFVLAPVTGLSCHRRLQDHRLANLISASGYQAHTTSPSACARIRLVHDKRPPHPTPNVRDDRETPLLSGTGRAEKCP